METGLHRSMETLFDYLRRSSSESGACADLLSN